MTNLTHIIEKYFLVWIVVFSLCGYHFPAIFKGLVAYIPLFLGIIMFGMGITLEFSDFVHIVKIPGALIAGVIGQFFIMPLVAYLLCIVFQLPPMLAIGVILVGTCPGGTASNVITYLSKGDVALSVALTTTTTLVSPLATPLLTYLYAGTWIQVPVIPMLVSILQVIIIPIVLGITIRYAFKEKIKTIITILPSVSVVAIVTIVAGITAGNALALKTVGLLVIGVVMVHNVLGLIMGYLASWLFGFDEKIRRTIAIEVGMQNSGLAVSLAVTHFEAISALPGALFSIWHNISGSFIAWWWRRH
ncbi:MAG TPA: bile acid:sodium symporter family protein [Spirochaetota bacterium]|nr:bile acid:sodium symporter family protein [Spirochaetota bacterium]